MIFTTDKGRRIAINPTHVVTVEDVLDEGGRTVIGLAAIVTDLIPVGPGQFIVYRVKGDMVSVARALGLTVVEFGSEAAR
jgi:hypothetical protein